MLMDIVKITEGAQAEIMTELVRAERQHPHWPEDLIHGVAIMIEEAGESMQAAIDLTYKADSDPRILLTALEKELVQTGAMVLRNLVHIRKPLYDY